jgi:hypothetical protein
MSDEPKVGFTGDPIYFDGTRVLPGPAMTATEIISRTAEADAAFEDKKAAMMQPLVDRTMEVMRKRGIHVPSDWRIPVAAAEINVEPEIPVTEVSSTWAFQEHRLAVSEAANQYLRTTIAEKSDRIAELEHDIRMLKADKVSDHNYHGPTENGKAVPDESHERFHGSIGDVLSGNIIRPARDQMERALADARAKDSAAPKSLPGITRSDDPRRIGG